MELFFRKLHRWLGLLMALQIIAWMSSGLYFAIFPIETIRGEHLVTDPAALNTSGMENLISPAVAWSAVSDLMSEGNTLKELSLYESIGQTWYRISGDSNDKVFTRLVNAHTGGVMKFIDEATAVRIATEALNVQGNVNSVEMITEESKGSEYRGRSLPLWRVSFSEPEFLNLYIDGWTGEVVARRTTRWRIFDFLWMLHIMDFDDRDDFNTSLLQVAAALGLLVALSGLVFWTMTTSLFRSRKSKHA